VFFTTFVDFNDAPLYICRRCAHMFHMYIIFITPPQFGHHQVQLLLAVQKQQQQQLPLKQTKTQRTLRTLLMTLKPHPPHSPHPSHPLHPPHCSVCLIGSACWEGVWDSVLRPLCSALIAFAFDLNMIYAQQNCTACGFYVNCGNCLQLHIYISFYFPNCYISFID